MVLPQSPALVPYSPVDRRTPGMPIVVGIGGSVITQGTTPLTTVLGSCLSLLVTVPSEGIAGMVHAIYPTCHPGDADETENPNLFVDRGFRALVREFLAMGFEMSDLKFRLYGGGKVLPVSPRSDRPATPGEANVAVAKKVLFEMGVVLSSMDVGGEHARKITVVPMTGKVVVMALKPLRTHQTCEE